MSKRKLYTSNEVSYIMYDIYMISMIRCISAVIKCILVLFCFFKSKKNKNAYAFGTSFYFIKKNILYKNEIYILYI